ncbi:MAG: DUF6912 family protein [Candidatus Nanopelagicales bacterium]
MRVYIPVTAADIDRRRTEGFWTISPRRAWAVNHQLALALPEEDDEGREFVASLTAASASASGLVLAADMQAAMLGDEGTNGEVEVSGILHNRDVACLLRLDAEDESLVWYAPTEFEQLLEL